MAAVIGMAAISDVATTPNAKNIPRGLPDLLRVEDAPAWSLAALAVMAALPNRAEMMDNIMN